MKTVVLLLFPLSIVAQDITGVWTGYLFTAENKLPYELVISGTNEKFSGYSLTVFTFDGKENIGVKSMKLKEKKGSFVLEDDELLYDNFTTPPKRVKLYANLSLSGKDTLMSLSGSFFTRSLDMRSRDEISFQGTVSLKKKNNFSQTKVMAKLSEMNLAGDLSFLQPKKQNKDVAKTKSKTTVNKPIVEKEKSKPIVSTAKEKPGVGKTIISPPSIAEEFSSRRTEVIQNLFFSSDSLQLSLYDNGEIDGDTVSILLNGKIIMAKQGLTTNAVVLKIYITPEMGDSIQLAMYAENLGRIPPNTGLLVLQDGAVRQEIRFSGDLQKNSAVILKRKRN